MVLKPKTVSEISAIEDDLAEIVAQLRKIRAGMVEKGIESIDLETDKAELFVTYLREEWVTRCYQRFEKAAVRKVVEKVRRQNKKEKFGSD